MAVVFTQDLPAATREMIEAVTTEMDIATSPPTGMLIHTASELPSGGIRIVDVWESKQAREAFGRDRLGPAMETVAKRLGFDPSSMPEPTQEFLETFDVRHGA